MNLNCYLQVFCRKMKNNFITRQLHSGNMRFQRQETIMNVFDRKTKLMQRERALKLPDQQMYNYLKDEIGYRVADRVFDVKRKFGVAVDLGCGLGHMSCNLDAESVETLYQCDMSVEYLRKSKTPENVQCFKIALDEEFLPFAENSLDLVASNLALHWVNDLPGCLKQINKSLKNDGVLIGSMFGGETLFELRCSLQLAELEREGGFAPHVSPFTDVRDLGNLLNRTGFCMITLDIDEIKVNYPSMMELMMDLKGMGENNCSWNRKLRLNQETVKAANAIYSATYGNEDGTVPATFQILYMIGWKPDPSQPQAAPRGSGTVSIKDLYKIDQLDKKK